MTSLISIYRFLYLSLASLIGYGWAIVALSFICSALMLPLMRAVAGIVNREKEYESVIDPQIAAIKRTYATDMDRHFHIQSLYARYAYSPLAPIKKVLPLFVQIPFLLLTYYMLKGTVQLSGVPFLFLSNLGTPDALITLSTSTSNLNLLPLLMTAVNILTVFATPGFTHKDWTQAIAISLLFLALLYTAPSALLLYWTLNNTITFVRTLCEKRFAGAHLLASRLASIPSGLTKLFQSLFSLLHSRTFLAASTFTLVMLATYFFVTARVFWTSGMGGGMTLTVTYKGMTFVMAAAAFVSLFHLWKDEGTNRFLLILGVVVNIGFVVSLVALFLCSRTLFIAAFQWMNMFVCFIVLFVAWMLPYIVRPRVQYKDFASNAASTIVEGWPYLLFPIILAVHYSFASVDFRLPPLSIALLSAYMLVPCLLLALLLSFLFRPRLSQKTIFCVVMAIGVGIYLVPMISSETGVLAYDRNLPIRILFIAAIAVFAALVRKRGLIGAFAILLLVLVIGKACFSHTKLEETASADEARVVSTMPSVSKLTAVLGGAKCNRTNDVYFLIFDSYPNYNVLKALKMDDPAFLSYLTERKFKLYDSYSVGCETMGAMFAAFTLNGVSGGSARSTISGDNVFSDFVREAGYRTSYFLNGYVMPNRGERMPGDVYFPTPEAITRPELVLLPCIVCGIFSQSSQTFNDYTHEEWMMHLNQEIDASTPGKNFIYAHSSAPGHVNWMPRYRKSDAEEQIASKGRIARVNVEIKSDVECILKKSPDAIIVLASDHGSQLMVPATPGKPGSHNILDRIGNFLAIRWPSDYKPCMKIDCLQNVLLEVMIYLSGDASLSRLASDGSNQVIEYPIGFPAGGIKRGIIQEGTDKGKSLFAAAREKFEKNGR